jgi:hypothetical protein
MVELRFVNEQSSVSLFALWRNLEAALTVLALPHHANATVVFISTGLCELIANLTPARKHFDGNDFFFHLTGPRNR